MMKLAQISDLHITGGELLGGKVDTAKFLARAVEKLRELAPDAVIATGDLVDGGSVAEYERLKILLEPLGMPVRLVLGNHDSRASFRSVFGGGDFIQFTFDVGGMRVIALDTNDPGNSGGRLCATRRAWLAEQLEEAAGRPVIVAQHHPPFVTGIPFMDSCGLDAGDAREEAAILARHPNVERVICGHVHRNMQARFGGTIATTAPSVAHQVALVLDDPEPAVTLEPPGLALHLWTGGGLVTHHVYCDTYAGL
ncbi:MAG TPA: phosphodiesterase [Kofleriaceae bacterium]